MKSDATSVDVYLDKSEGEPEWVTVPANEDGEVCVPEYIGPNLDDAWEEAERLSRELGVPARLLGSDGQVEREQSFAD